MALLYVVLLIDADGVDPEPEIDRLGAEPL